MLDFSDVSLAGLLGKKRSSEKGPSVVFHCHLFVTLLITNLHGLSEFHSA